ncbi:MAG: 2-dehydro-3-deoxy-6-phosphogalactonate aldolase, partial [Xanthomonadaceae bacterium]|nr:2-dehydro-3-deoxy-6-phosphogalactonate aldolase [Xanthomonadaceae bacterium]
MLKPWLEPLPLVAILRGLAPDEAVATGRAIVAAGFRVLEVPLNSPQPLDSIARLAEALGADVLLGAGTVMTPAQVDAVANAGGRLIVMPHADTAVIRAAKAAGLLCVPGVATPTEAFAALAAGADGLKLFPAEQFSPAVLKAWR